MRVFLSWSGKESQKVALALKDWLPTVVQALDTWVSSADIEKGEAWITAISESLDQADGVGIFCLTNDNLRAPWIAFEAGALAAKDRARVATFLFNVTASDVAPPLSLFQATSAQSKEDVFQLVQMLNKRLVHPLPDGRLTKSFDAHWPSLEASLQGIRSDPSNGVKPQRNEGAILEEILAVVRRIERLAPERSEVNLGFGWASKGQPPLGGGLLGSSSDAADLGIIQEKTEGKVDALLRQEKLNDLLDALGKYGKSADLQKTLANLSAVNLKYTKE